MLPPIDASVLEKNPQFAQFHKQLSLSILNSDGSTKQSAERKKASNTPSQEKLAAFQLYSARLRLLRCSLSEITCRVEELPEELLEVIEIISAQLNTPYFPSDWEILQEDVIYFEDHIKSIGKVVSDHLTSTALQLSKIIHCTDNVPAKSARSLISSLPQELATRRAETLEKQESLLSQRLALGQLACRILEAHKEYLETIIRFLEQSKHGNFSRGLKAQAEHLAALADIMDGKLQILESDAISQIYTPDVQSALCHYYNHLKDTITRLQQRRKTANEILGQYESAGPGMNEIASKYGQFQKEIEAARADIQRLGGQP
ncbi:hypothetical protein L228DRAFT_31640 [Xylona heveae TC161]|uniref:HAUS augmin-like complex subunit 4 n=1 Tax=Xylona heveae (strain CBS 132557 / TC161) TaxID=1328760 RepID=A0A165A4J9_XYLHT|nr:hypothetical protein L228DRAFT_31640 [Xylona heveae TC161]KZF19938.1 hypothetical protein L228DRAFT_31640 [Xylona heveae TC161]